MSRKKIEIMRAGVELYDARPGDIMTIAARIWKGLEMLNLSLTKGLVHDTEVREYKKTLPVNFPGKGSGPMREDWYPATRDPDQNNMSIFGINAGPNSTPYSLGGLIMVRRASFKLLEG